MPAPSHPVLTELSWCPPEVLFSLCKGQPYSVFLDSGGDPTHSRSRWSYLCPTPSSHYILPLKEAHTLTPTLRAFHHHFAPSLEELPFPFYGGTIGLITYETGLAYEGITSQHHKSSPAVIALSCRNLFIIDRQDKRLWWVSPDNLPPPSCPTTPITHTHPSFPCTAAQTPAEWMHAVSETKKFIEAGDIFQANLTMRWYAPRFPNTDLLPLYQHLRNTCPAPFGAWFHTPNFSLLSASVERFVSLSNNIAETRPIKGTIGISSNTRENDHLRATLQQDAKECAENLMITDLMRHDLGKVSQLGSVTVPQLCAVEKFTHVHHLVSSVQSTLHPYHDAFDLLEATLPPGSVTGAPKHRALEIIDTLENSARNAYCGTLFRLGWNNNLDSSVIIRSIEASPSRFHIGAGGGITWPSHPLKEYEEMVLKATPLLHVMENKTP